MKRQAFVMFTLIVLLILHIAVSSASAAKRGNTNPSVSWIFDIHRGQYDVPYGKVYLVINGRRVLLIRHAHWRYWLLNRNEFSDRKMPVSTIAACSGWYGGWGQDLYVVKRHGRLRVFVRYQDESDEKDEGYHFFRSIRY